MQEAAKQSSGKLEQIKTIREVLPFLEVLSKKCREARAQLDVSVAALRGLKNDFASQREESMRRAEKTKKYEELIKQRESERRAAEEIIDKKAVALATKAKEQRTSSMAMAFVFFCRVSKCERTAWRSSDSNLASSCSAFSLAPTILSSRSLSSVVT